MNNTVKILGAAAILAFSSTCFAAANIQPKQPPIYNCKIAPNQTVTYKPGDTINSIDMKSFFNNSIVKFGTLLSQYIPGSGSEWSPINYIGLNTTGTTINGKILSTTQKGTYKIHIYGFNNKGQYCYPAAAVTLTVD